tara:strand:- start:710 stop:994 length:285 start_codon:yes stop_codon:yes gene_type:complete
MKTTKELFEELDQDHLNILGCGESILRTAKEEINERDKIIKKMWEYYDRLEKALKENQELKQNNEEKGRIIENLKEDMKELKLQLETINKPLKK